MSVKMNRITELLMIAVFCCCVFLVFAPVINSFFDPQEFISFLNPFAEEMPVGRYMVESWSWVNDSGELIGFFRPLVSATFMVEYPFFGTDPLGYKLVNLGMHLLCAFFIARFVMVLSGKKWLAMFAGALFTLHPGTVVATGMIVSRHDILVCLFSILALTSTYNLSRTSKVTWKALLPSFFMLLAVNSKELGMMNLIALPIMYFLWPARLKCKRNTIVFISSLVFVEIIYLIARELVFGNIGGYGSYTQLTAIPMHIYTVVSQATGAFFIERGFLRVFLYLSLAGVMVNFIRTGKQNWREVLVALLVTGAYSSQSVIGDVATHYVYTAAALTVLFFVYFAGSLVVPGKKSRQASVAIVVMTVVLIISGVLTRRESTSFNRIYANCEKVYTSLELIANSLPDGEGSICLVQVSDDSPIEAEMKNVLLYIKSIAPGSDCEFIRFREFTDEMSTPVPILVWSGNEITVREFPASASVQ